MGFLDPLLIVKSLRESSLLLLLRGLPDIRCGSRKKPVANVDLLLLYVIGCVVVDVPFD